LALPCADISAEPARVYIAISVEASSASSKAASIHPVISRILQLGKGLSAAYQR
jgi:hypothetical protein